MAKTTRPKGDIIGKSKQLIKKGTVSTKKWYIYSCLSYIYTY